MMQEQLDVKIAIINNGYLGMVRQWQEFFHDKRYAATPMLLARLREAGRRLRHRRATVSSTRDRGRARGSTRARARQGRR